MGSCVPRKWEKDASPHATRFRFRPIGSFASRSAYAREVHAPAQSSNSLLDDLLLGSSACVSDAVAVAAVGCDTRRPLRRSAGGSDGTNRLDRDPPDRTSSAADTDRTLPRRHRGARGGDARRARARRPHVRGSRRSGRTGRRRRRRTRRRARSAPTRGAGRRSVARSCASRSASAPAPRARNQRTASRPPPTRAPSQG